MDFQEALNKSSKGTASRVELKNSKKYITIGYKDGSGILLVSENNKVNFAESREASKGELIGFTDWYPSEQL